MYTLTMACTHDKEYLHLYIDTRSQLHWKTTAVSFCGHLKITNSDTFMTFYDTFRKTTVASCVNIIPENLTLTMHHCSLYAMPLLYVAIVNN